MTKNTALLIAGLIFAIVAIAHFLRYVFNVEVIVSGYVLPMNLSLFALLIAAFLSIAMFVARKK